MEVSGQDHAWVILPPVGRLLISDIFKSMLCGRKSILSWFSWRNMRRARKTSVSVDGLRAEFRIVDAKKWLPFRPRSAVAYQSERRVWEHPPPPSSFYRSVFSSLLPIAPVQWPELILGIQLFTQYSAWGRVFLLGCIWFFSVGSMAMAGCVLTRPRHIPSTFFHVCSSQIFSHSVLHK
jgi:hypothetical protein